MQYSGTLDLKTELPKYGLTESNIRLFDTPESPDLLDYLDLTKRRQQKELSPDGVAESQGRPLLFFVNESQLSIPPEEKEAEFGNLSRILACRGDRAYLARVRPGELLVIPVSLSDITPEWKLYRASSGEAITFFSRLAQGYFDGEGEPGEADFVFREMLNLLNKGSDRLAELIEPVNVLSLLGRALFFRFLCDRKIVTEKDVTHIAPKASTLLDCFKNSENAHATNQWLDKTFNGDFLPLDDGGSRAFFDMIANKSSDSVFFHLKAITQGFTPIGKEAYQTKWSNFNFAHVPVGLLSQVYEAFCWKWEHRSAKETSVYYTPRKIAQVLVDEAFDGLPKANEARVLDPACGAGVFLVLAFRRLYRERWAKTAERPDTKAIREILDNQLAGFDISSSALKLTALALYLTAIELDPKPIPPEKLKFNQLNGKVLFNHRQDDDQVEGPTIGSLGEHIGSRFDGQYDVVLSNPPWTSLSKEYSSIAAKYTVVSKAIIERKGEITMAQAYQNTDYAPDMPILWKSTEWCKPGGRIAMALPARILFKQEDIPSRARETMFRLIDVTGIINGSNLSDTEVWPKMSQPFMLFFARNNRPKDSHVIHFITPHYDKMLNRKGEIRIDSKSAQSVEIAATFDEPWLWKALTIGTPLDTEVIRRVRSVDGRQVNKYWKADLGLTSSMGYKILGLMQYDASFLQGLPNFTASYQGRFSVDTGKLRPFTHVTANRPRKLDCYRAPLVLVKQSPGFSRENCRAFLCFEDVAFSRDFYGYSSANHPDSELLAQYLFLFCHSQIWLHYVLMTASVFGAERRVIYKTDLDDCPVVPLERLNGEQRNKVTELSQRLLKCDMSAMPEIDSFFGNLYGLDALDLEVICDTLEVCLPYGESRTRACGEPTDTEIEIFRQRLEMVIRPFFKVIGKEPQVIVWKPNDTFLQKEAPFGIVIVSEQGRPTIEPDAYSQRFILKLADDTGTTRIIQQIENGLLVGILRQYRYWTPSRARLLGSEIVRQHMGVFEE